MSHKPSDGIKITELFDQYLQKCNNHDETI